MVMFRQVPLSRPLRRSSKILGRDQKNPLHNGLSTTSLITTKPAFLASFGGLTLDVWTLVFNYLLPPDLLQLAQLNSLFNAAVTSCPIWRFYETLFPTSRKIWALTWAEACEGYFARTAPTTSHEKVTYNLTEENLPQDQPFRSLFLGTNRRVIEFFGPSVRHRHDTFLTQVTPPLGLCCRSWRITSTLQYSMGGVLSIQNVVVDLPPRGHHLRPAGLDVVGTFLFWVDFEDSPIGFDVTSAGLLFEDDNGEMALWPDNVFDEDGGELCLLHKLFLSWGESQFEFSGQMCCAAPNVRAGGRKQNLRLYDYEKNRAYLVSFDA